MIRRWKADSAILIGLQIDMKAMRSQSGDIVWLTVLNSTVPFLLGASVILAQSYGWLLAFVIGLTCMPTAEAVIRPSSMSSG